MVAVSALLSLVASAMGALGGTLVFVEFFQTPSYVSYEPEWDNWNMTISPTDVEEYSWAGRIGALLVALAFALQFVATLLAGI